MLSDAEIRQGVKEYANWPTVPQLYVNGEFVGGADIMREMYQSGELQKMLETVRSRPPATAVPGQPNDSLMPTEEPPRAALFVSLHVRGRGARVQPTTAHRYGSSPYRFRTRMKPDLQGSDVSH